MTAEPGAGQADLDRNLAYLAYGLLFFSFFFAGAPALIAVAIAYSRRTRAEPLAARHHSYQIWVFWVGFGLGVLASACALAAVAKGFADVFGVLTDGDPTASLDQFFDEVYGRLGDSRSIPTLLITSIVFLISTGFWLAGAAAYGVFRLASGKPVGQARMS